MIPPDYRAHWANSVTAILLGSQLCEMTPLRVTTDDNGGENLRGL